MKILAFIFLLAMIVSLPCPAQAQSPQQTLNQYVADLQKNPNDYALREKIIRHVQTMKPAPAVPEETRRFMNRGMAAAEGAKTESDYRDAIQEFQKAVNIAPWLGSGYRNLAVVQDKAGLHSQAIQNLKLYLLTNPPAADAEAAKTLMDKIEYRQEKAVRESSPQALAAKKQRDYEQCLKRIDGRSYSYRNTFERTTTVLDVKGNVLIQGAIIDPDSPLVGRRGYIEYERYEIRDRVAAGPVMDVPGSRDGSYQLIYTISESGDRITEQTRRGSGKTSERILLWQR